MVQSVIVYSEIIPTILAVMGIFFLCSGVLDHNRAYTTLGVFLFILANSPDTLAAIVPSAS